ncbi:MAG: DUF1571 domain-containing protein [Myxococcaceae bacterium]
MTDLSSFSSLPLAERKSIVSKEPREALASWFKNASVEQLLDANRKAAKSLSPYSTTLTKRERIDGKLQEPSTLNLIVRDSPFAVRAEFTAGESKGRKVLYDETVKKDQFRVREGGLLGMAGAIWLGLDNPLAKRESNHRITDLGFLPTIGILEDAFTKAKALGGYARADDGFDKRGFYCLTFTAPKGGESLYATRAKICIDPALAVPVELEIDDAKGPLERYSFSSVAPVSNPDFTSKL